MVALNFSNDQLILVALIGFFVILIGIFWNYAQKRRGAPVEPVTKELKPIIPEVLEPPEAELEQGKPPKTIWVLDRSGELSYHALPAKLKGNPGELVIPQPSHRGGRFDISLGARTLVLSETERQAAWLYFPKAIKGWIRAYITDGGLVVPWGLKVVGDETKVLKAMLEQQAKLFRAAMERKTMELAYKGSSVTSQLIMGVVIGVALGAMIALFYVMNNPGSLGLYRFVPVTSP